VSLTTGRGPFSRNPAGRFNADLPAEIVYVEPHQRRVRAVLGDRTVIDTERAQLVHRRGAPPSYAFPADVVPPELATPEPEVPGHVAVSWGSVDAWYEEDVHLTFNRYPKNPYHRVDCLPTSRRLRVEILGVVVVDATDTLGVYETALAPKLYVPKSSIRMDLLSVSGSTSWCSYKGSATWWNATVNGESIPEVAWSYEDPLHESWSLRGMLAFDEQRVSVTAEVPDGPS
jgi:uncharacterized protein (DUF427 family)